MILTALPDIMLEPLVRAALLEDLGRAGDVTSEAIIPADQLWKAGLVSRSKGIVAGLALSQLAFYLIDPTLAFIAKKKDGDEVAPGEIIASVQGNARMILTAERVALNFLCHLSGIASATHKMVEAVKPHKAHIVCTRKTTPGLRSLEKYAVRAGGGFNHRYGLDDAILIKDNHIAVAGGVRPAVERARAAAGHLVKVELEVDTLAQLREALTLPIDAILLDNMALPILHEAVTLVGGRFITEASGHVTVETVYDIAATGVDVISSGALTHSSRILDIGLDEI